jgi:hypothetical protein
MKKLTFWAAIAVLFTSSVWAQTPTPTATATATPSTGLVVSSKPQDLNLGPGQFFSADKQQTLRAALNRLVLLTDGTTITADLSKGNAFAVTLAGNRTITFGTTHNPGNVFRLIVTQDGVGSRTVTWNAAIHWPGGTAPTLTTTPAKTDIFQCSDTGAAWTCSTVGLNY